jgi:hypothetical protein
VHILIGEIIESRTAEFIAEALRYDRVPAYGSFVRAQDGNLRVYAIVSGAYTGSLDGTGKAKAFFKSLDQLKLEQPQIFELLRTEFSCVVVGYADGGRYHPYYPPIHLNLHLPVEEADDEEILSISQHLGFLDKTLNSPTGDGEELTAAAIRTAAHFQPDPRGYIIKAGRELLKMMNYDTQRLKSILERVDIR